MNPQTMTMEPTAENLRTLPWYAVNGAEREGPFTADQMLEHFRYGHFTATTLVWCSAYSSWLVAGSVPLFAQFAPPPVSPVPPPPSAEARGVQASAPPPPPGRAAPGPGASAAARRPRLRSDYRHPWHRAFARMIDANIVGTILYVLLVGSAPDLVESAAGLSFLAMAGTVVFDAFCWANWGTTPGKRLFDIRVLGVDGRPLDFAVALRRAAAVWFRGLALGFPLVVLFTGNWQLRRLNREESASYDEGSPWRVEVDELTRDRQVLATLISAGVLALAFWGAQHR